MKWLLLLGLGINIFSALAQSEKTFIPSAFLDTVPEDVHNTLKARLLNDKGRVTVKGREGDYIKTLYDQRFDYVVSNFNEDRFILDHPLTATLRKITDRIYATNPQLPRELSIYTYRSSVPNAVSFGEGTICLMLGLLERVETEDQVAYILCHEFAHYYAQHAERNIAELAALNYDKELKRTINDIKKDPYRTYAKLKALFNSLDLSLSRHNRKSEFEADSLGLVYYLNTGYNPYAPLRVMQILGNADRGLFTKNIDFKKYFDFKAFPFQDSWIDYSPSDMIYASPDDEEEGDTLKTHPNTKRRFDRIQRQLRITDLDSTQLYIGESFSHLSELASFEILSSHYHFREYGKALFSALVLAESYPRNPYPHAMISKSLYQLYKAQKDHNLEKVLELPDPRFDENYNRFLSFINKLRLHELASLAYEYATTRPTEFYTDEEFIHALWQCSRFEFSKVDAEKVALEYEQLYPNGRYLQEMKNKK